jgi:uncharacterized protein YyaL (SSP411 family)
MNLLGQETSPYLLQHRDNPVHWRPWGEDAFAEAKRRNVPVLLSVGYAACHWCHVMAHESFENQAIADAMNANFVNIKVDREERPDVDAIYQSALALLGQQGGWPLTMFVTPDGEPFWGGTYFPPEQRYGRPGFPEVLRSLSETWQTRQDAVAHNVAALKEALAQHARPNGTDTLSPALVDDAARLAQRQVDPFQGGTQGAPKFPQPSFFRFLWIAFRRTGARPLREAVTLTLERMSQGGIYDHLGGGFARYSTDDAWLVPHFEKMLYDNALLLELLADAWAVTRTDLFRVRAQETVDWLLTDMKTGEGEAGEAFGLASARDADSEGEEGKYYVWTEGEIQAVLGEDAAAFAAAYDVSRDGNWEGHTILNRSRRPALKAADEEQRLAAQRARLLAVRARRIEPMRDDKVLADWNGMAAAALAHAGAIFERPDWIAAAAAIVRFVEGPMTVEGRLRHTWRDGRARHPATLDDHAQIARAALALFEATQDGRYIDLARRHADAIERHFRDDAGGGYFLSADDTTDVLVRTKTAFDNAVPSGNGATAEVLARLWLLTGDERLRARAEACVKAFAGDGPERLVHMPSLMSALDLLERGTQVIVAGPDGADADALMHAATLNAPPLRAIRRVGPGDALPTGHPASAKGAVDGRAAAYVCIGATCSLPTVDADALARQLAPAS